MALYKQPIQQAQQMQPAQQTQQMGDVAALEERVARLERALVVSQDGTQVTLKAGIQILIESIFLKIKGNTRVEIKGAIVDIN